MLGSKIQVDTKAKKQLDALLKNAPSVQVFRRAQAVRGVVQGETAKVVAQRFEFNYSRLCYWVHRFEAEGTAGLHDRPRAGRPPKITGEVERYMHTLFDQRGLSDGEVRDAVARRTGMVLSRETVRRKRLRQGAGR